MSTRKQKIQQFYEFLVEEGALFNYLKYATFESLRYGPSSSFLIQNISWANTEEGLFYWMKLNKLWYHKLGINQD